MSSTLSFDQIHNILSIDEWLDTYNYYIKLFPSQTKEIMKIGAMCYSNLFMYREDLKAAILSHPVWILQNSLHPPIFDLFISEFIANGKKTKMIFMSTEQSKAQETVTLFKQLYDGRPKTYPNGYMMLFILLLEGHQPTPEFHSKVLFNHLKFLGDEAAFSIGGFQDLKSIIKLKIGNMVLLGILIESIPASAGMTQPQLFQHVEPSISSIVTMVTSQKQRLNPCLYLTKNS
jgi:hypothetical protein